MLDKLGGRKFISTIGGVILAIIVPIVYKQLQIGDSITQIVIGTVAAAIGTYGVTNVMGYKYGENDNKEESQK